MISAGIIALHPSAIFPRADGAIRASSASPCSTFFFSSYTSAIILSGTIATSIDAFAVGITIALLKDPILISSVIIGIVAFVFSIIGIYIGKKLGNYVGDKFQIIGGVILILIGIKILLGF